MDLKSVQDPTPGEERLQGKETTERVPGTCSDVLPTPSPERRHLPNYFDGKFREEKRNVFTKTLRTRDSETEFDHIRGHRPDCGLSIRTLLYEN